MNLGEPSGFFPTSFCTGTPTLDCEKPLPVLDESVSPFCNLAFNSACLLSGVSVPGASGSNVGSILSPGGVVAGVVPAGGNPVCVPVPVGLDGFTNASNSCSP